MPQNIQIRTLQPEDASALFQFELENRAWFERYVLSRGDGFYTEAAVAEHIRECLHAYAEERMHPCLVLDGSGNIIGRANLKDIDAREGTTEVGYRIAQEYVGRGVASQALSHLMRLAYNQWQLKRLSALVTVANPASAKVLEKAGFVCKGMDERTSEINQQTLGRYRYEHFRNTCS